MRRTTPHVQGSAIFAQSLHVETERLFGVREGLLGTSAAVEVTHSR